jgi:uncharacterized protein YjbI with pentapeptide repeats
MPIVGPAFEDLRDAIASAFPSRSELDDLTSFDLEIDLASISPAVDTHPEAVKKVIRWADSNGGLPAFVAKAKLRNPGNQLLQRFDESRLEPDRRPGEVVAADTAGDFDVRLAGVVEKLASGNHVKQASAVVVLQGLTATGSRPEQLALYATTVANLRVPYPDDVQRALVKVLQTSLVSLCGTEARPPDVNVDLNRVSLPRVDLSGLDLSEADIAFAELAGANLTSCDLWRSRGYGVDLRQARLSRSNLEEARLRSASAPQAQFHEARMVSIRLEDADLRGAEFQQARLQGAHLDGSDLSGAEFAAADLADADLRGATIDDVAAQSIGRAKNWRKAKLSPESLAMVEEHAT